MDTTTPTGKMIFPVVGAVAELERSLIVECVRAGLRNARAKGKRVGRPKRNQIEVESWSRGPGLNRRRLITNRHDIPFIIEFNISKE
jgi:DNA invertase Pin-like site-specific DNA recombinase